MSITTDSATDRNPDRAIINNAATFGARLIAQVGIREAATSDGLARQAADAAGELHLFDCQDRVDDVLATLRTAKLGHVACGHGNERRSNDPYCRTLLRLLRERPDLRFDYVVLSGSGCVERDTLACLLIDRLLLAGGYLDMVGASPDVAGLLGTDPRYATIHAGATYRKVVDGGDNRRPGLLAATGRAAWLASPEGLRHIARKIGHRARGGRDPEVEALWREQAMR